MGVNKLTKYILTLIILNFIAGILWFNSLKPIIKIESKSVIFQTLTDYFPIITIIALVLLFILILNLIYLNIKPLKQIKISKQIKIILILIFAVGLILRVFVIPHIHNLYFDEIAYMDTAKYMGSGKICVCLERINGECNVCGVSYKSIGFSFILAILFKIFSVNSNIAFLFSAIIGSLSIIIMYFLSFLIWKKERLALFSAGLLSIYPLHLRWSGSAAPEITSLFFILLTFLFLFLFFEIKKKSTLILSILLLILTITIKEENFLLIPFFIILLFSFGDFIKDIKKKSVIFGVLILILIAPYIIGTFLFHLQSETGIEGISTNRYTFSKDNFIFSFDFLKENFLRNILLWFNIEYNLIIVIFMFVLGLIVLFKRDIKKGFFLIAWPLSIITLFSAYLPLPLYDSDARHYIPLIITLILVAAHGFNYLVTKLKLMKIIIPILILISVGFHWQYLLSENATVFEAQEEYNFIKEGTKIIDESCLILMPEAYILDYLERDTLSTYLIKDGNESKISERECVYYYEGLMCYFEIPEHCKDMRKRFELTPLIQKNVKGLKYTFYKVLN